MNTTTPVVYHKRRHSRKSYCLPPDSRGNSPHCGTLPARVADIRPGSKIGYLTVTETRRVPLGHHWSWGWKCDCLDTCETYAWAFTDARCDPACKCNRMGWKITLQCACGNSIRWITGDVLNYAPSLACKRSCQVWYGLAFTDELVA